MKEKILGGVCQFTFNRCFWQTLFFLTVSITVNYAQQNANVISKTSQNHQSILASAGGVQKFSEIELEWTLGESFIGETTNSSRIYTIGFHQPFIIQAEKQKNQPESDEVSIFPNPVGNKLNVKFNLKNAENATQFKFLLTDLMGRQILEKTIDSSMDNSVIDFPEITSGSYQVKIVNSKNTVLRTFKIIKTN
jgi:Secretion system C-terminal sorting domain